MVIAESAESVNQSRKARPAQPSEAAVLQPADDRLVDVTKGFEVALREPEMLAAAADQPADEFEPTPSPRVLASNAEQMPSHDEMLAGKAHLPNSCARFRQPRSAAMYVDCITEAPDRLGVARAGIDGDVAAHQAKECIGRRVVRPVRGDPMQSTCIAEEASLQRDRIGRREVHPWRRTAGGHA
jgi:hypothetical protein